MKLGLVEWNGDRFLKDIWEIKTSRLVNYGRGFLVGISFPWQGEQSLQDIWAAATASLSDLLLFITCKSTQNPTHHPFFFLHYLNPSIPLKARTTADKAFTECGNNLAKRSAKQIMSTLKSFSSAREALTGDIYHLNITKMPYFTSAFQYFCTFYSHTHSHNMHSASGGKVVPFALWDERKTSAQKKNIQQPKQYILSIHCLVLALKRKLMHAQATLQNCLGRC